ncbi:MAG: alpha/beta hydrolase [Phycisphaerae bacterium]|nr:alpha/beta hydrolase [Phycisphaerae bacterium]
MAKKTLTSRVITFAAIIVLAASCSTLACYGNIGCAKSFDSELISYSVFGKGDITLVFVHGWSCDSRYWRYQIPYFARKYQVVTIDLAGHGNSGQGRQVYSLESFSEDIKAVVEKLDAKKVILIGHSMSGEIVAKASTLMPGRVIGVIGVDTIQNVEDTMPEEQFDTMTTGMKTDFKGTVKNFVESMLGKDMKPELKQWIIDDMSAAPPNVATSAFVEYVEKFENKGIANLFKEVKVPVRCVNADLWPTNPEVNRKYIASYNVVFMKNAGHFIQLERPDEFNKLLHRSIKEILGQK